ncbi:amino acid adenylation domain-containing protein [Streptomyces sp. NPDC058657]|uniref:non-ribosomal peptide synthetase n=1 Tax=unclassified Streptomyces TaxID=2593676 RepID=UPI003646F1D1
MSDLKRVPRRAARVPGSAPGTGGARQALQRLQESRRTEQRIERADRDRSLPLAAAQQRLWFLDQWSPGSAAYNAPLALRLTGPLDPEVLGRALSGVVERHEILRTRYGSADGLPHQIVQEPQPVAVVATDLRELPDDEREKHVTELIAESAGRPFDLATGPVLRAELFRLADEEHVLLLNIHHIATDGWSTAIVTREVMVRYAAEAGGLPDPLPALPVQFADYAVWQRGRLADAAFGDRLDYWTGRLADLPVLDFPTDRPRPRQPTGAGSVRESRLPAHLQKALVELARSERVTVLTVTLAAFQTLLARYTGQDDIVVGSVVNGRTQPEIEPLVGFFANTLVLRTDTSGNPTFRELLARTNETVVGGLMHQDVPFGKLVDALQPEREAGRNPLFQISFTLQNASADGDDLGGLRIEQVPLIVGTARFDLAFQLTEVPGEGYHVWIEYSTELFDSDRIDRLISHYGRLLEAVVADPGVRLGHIPLLDPAERERLVIGENRTDTAYESSGLALHQLFERSADRFPEQPAVRFRGGGIGYRELDRRANQLAHHLRALGVGPESRVGILLERGPDLAVTQLAVLKAGGAYVPLDPVHPTNRLAYMLERAGAAIVVTEGALGDVLPETVTRLDWRDPQFLDAVAARPQTRPEVAVHPRSLAYVIFTSGSTGKPKGVLVEHRSAVNFTAAAVEMFGLGPDDRMLQFANPAFDVSVFEIFSAFASGATLVSAPRGTLLDPAALTALMREEGVTTADIPPSVLGVLDPAGLPDFRKMFVGLESFPGDLVDRWRDGGRRAFHNGYGPTETTVASVDHLCGPQNGTASPPIGRPLPNQYAYVLDPSGEPVPLGVAGELWIGGLGLSRGYAGSPGATADRFLPDPFAGGGRRMYRTGDLALRRSDGNLEFFGRADTQVKIRGLRIEPSEIEQVLVRHPGVRQAAVVVLTSLPGGPQLVAYVVPESGTRPEPAALRGHLADDLPPYMLPGSFVLLDALPLTPNGKLDRARLPEPEQRAGKNRQAPATGTERAVAEIWAGLLPGSDFARDDNFFMAGGNSLQATQLLAKIHEVLGAEVQLRQLFTHATVEQLAALVDAGRGPAAGTVTGSATAAAAGTVTGAGSETAAATGTVTGAGSEPAAAAATGAGSEPAAATATDADAAEPVLLTAGGDRTPLFCIHPSGGSVAPYVPLAASLHPDQPLYALQAPELGATEDPVAALADAHAATIRAARPQGPYLIGGWSTGGAVAFETARRLRLQGAEVALVALLDTDVPPGLTEPPSTAQTIALYVADLVGLRGADPAAAPALDIDTLDYEEQIAVAVRTLATSELAPEGSAEQLAERMRTFVATVRAGAVWRPGTIDVPLAHLTSEAPGAADRARFWESRTTGGFTHRQVPGDHYEVVAAPHVGTVADVLQEILDRATAAHRGATA